MLQLTGKHAKANGGHPGHIQPSLIAGFRVVPTPKIRLPLALLPQLHVGQASCATSAAQGLAAAISFERPRAIARAGATPQQTVPEGMLSREDDSEDDMSGSLASPNAVHCTGNARAVPEGMLSREDDSDDGSGDLGGISSGSRVQPEARGVPEGMLSREDDSDDGSGDLGGISSGAGVQPEARGVPEGMLSREDDSDDGSYDLGGISSGAGVQPEACRVPEGMLSREDP